MPSPRLVSHSLPRPALARLCQAVGARALCALCALCTLLTACGGSGGADTAPPVQAGLGDVAGYALDDHVLQGTVRIYALGQSTAAYQTTTTDLGRFIVPGTLAAGSYRVVITGGVEDADGLAATTADQRSFSGSLSALIQLGTTRAPFVVNAVTTGLQRHAGEDLTRYQAALAALPEVLKALAALDTQRPVAQVLGDMLAVQRALGFETIALELTDDGQLNGSNTELGVQPLKNVVNNLTAPAVLADVTDPNLRLCIADALEKDSAEVTRADLDTLTRLNCNDYGIQSLAGLATALPQLAYLHAESNGIDNLQPLAGMTRLVLLNLRNNRLATLAPLRQRSSPQLAMLVAENCITEASELNDSDRLLFSQHDLRAKRQFSNCLKNDAEVLAFALRLRTDGQYLLTYRTSYNPQAQCRIDWGDGSSTEATCDGRTVFAAHRYTQPNGQVVALVVNGSTKRTALVPPPSPGVAEGPPLVNDALRQPNGGEYWMNSTSQPVRWQAEAFTGPTVELWVLHDDPTGLLDKTQPRLGAAINGKRWYHFGVAVPNTGVWTGDPALLNGKGNGYMVLVVSSARHDQYDLSDALFSLGASNDAAETGVAASPAVLPGRHDTSALLTPNGGERWFNNTPQTIRWRSTSLPGDAVDIYLLTDDPSPLMAPNPADKASVINGRNWLQIAQAVPNSGQHLLNPVFFKRWGNAYMLLVVSRADRSQYDLSDGFFNLNRSD